MKIQLTILSTALWLCIACNKTQSTPSITEDASITVKIGERQSIVIQGIKYEIFFSDVVEERCDDCTKCYKPSGIYADAIFTINEMPLKGRIYTCDIQQETTWAEVERLKFNLAIKENLQVGVIKLSPTSNKFGDKPSYILKLLFHQT